MTEEWDEYAEMWDSNEDVIAYSKKAFKSLKETVSLDGLRVLDFGCGTGLLTEKISPIAKEIVALDTSEKMTTILSNKNLANVTVVQEEISDSLITTNQSFSEKFDLIVASSVCGFLPDLEKTLAMLKSLLVPDGVFVQWDWLATEGQDGFGLSRNKIINAYDKAGLKLEALELAFALDSSEGSMPVLKGIAKNA